MQSINGFYSLGCCYVKKPEVTKVEFAIPKVKKSTIPKVEFALPKASAIPQVEFISCKDLCHSSCLGTQPLNASALRISNNAAGMSLSELPQSGENAADDATQCLTMAQQQEELQESVPQPLETEITQRQREREQQLDRRLQHLTQLRDALEALKANISAPMEATTTFLTESLEAPSAENDGGQAEGMADVCTLMDVQKRSSASLGSLESFELLEMECMLASLSETEAKTKESN